MTLRDRRAVGGGQGGSLPPPYFLPLMKLIFSEHGNLVVRSPISAR